MPDIGPGQKAGLLEAYAATISLLPSSLRSELPVIGGASLVMLGSKRKTEDVDFAVSANALFAFDEAACNDPRFSKGTVAEWTYSCQEEGIKDLKISLEFLQTGGGFVPNIKVIKPLGEGFRAGMGELMKMKANAYTARMEDYDIMDFRFLPEKMEEIGEGFEGVELEEDLEKMQATAADCGGRYPDLLQELLRKAGH